MQDTLNDNLPCVAVIDDDATIRSIMHEMLQDGDYHVVLWDGLEDRLEFVDRCQPDIVIHDVHLGPTLTIWPLLDHLATLPRKVAPRVIVCSADRDFLREHGCTLREHGCAIIEKPFDIDDFLDTVASCLTALGR